VKVVKHIYHGASSCVAGTYQLRESIFLAQPPPHPAESTTQPPNPLDTARKPPTVGTKLSLVVVTHKRSPLQKFAGQGSPTSASSSSLVESQQGNRSSTNSNPFTSSHDPEEALKSPIFGQHNPALAPIPNGKEVKDGKDGPKRKKPKNNLVKTNSSFVSRVQPADGLNKKLNEHDPSGIFAYANIGRSFQWLDLSAPIKTKVLAQSSQ
jgi:catabolite repression protein CreC